MTRATGSLLAVLAGLATAATGPAVAQEREVHGANAVFAAHGVVIVWGVLRAATEEQTRVVVRIAPSGDAYAFLAVDGVDPFTRARRSMLDAAAIDGPVEVRMPRAGFADFPRREIRLWRAGQAALTVYYLGVPDTTPEFASEAALGTYLEDAVARARPRAGGP